MSCVQLIYFALPLRQNNFISNRKAKNVQALKVFSSDVLKYCTVLIWSRWDFVTATWKATLPVFSLSSYPVEAESIPQRGGSELHAVSCSDTVHDLRRASVRVCWCVSKQHLHFKALSLSPGFGHDRDGLSWQKMSMLWVRTPVGSLSLLLQHLTPSSPPFSSYLPWSFVQLASLPQNLFNSFIFSVVSKLGKLNIWDQSLSK